jgi:hypothetical protein
MLPGSIVCAILTAEEAVSHPVKDADPSDADPHGDLAHARSRPY